MTKKIISLLLCFLMLFSAVNVTAETALAADTTMTVLTELVKKFPAGKYWNHVGSDENMPDGVTSKPCVHDSSCSWVAGACSCNSFDNAIQCKGYALKTAYEIVGSSARKWDQINELDPASLCVGDVICFLNGGHFMTVTGVNKNTIGYTDANGDHQCGIRWSTIDASKVTGFKYVLHEKNNTRKNNKPDFYNSVDIPEEAYEVKAEVWKMSNESSLNVRASASLSASKVGSIPAGAKYTVTQKVDDGSYLWGKVEYGSVFGWAALNYSSYISGCFEKPVLSFDESTIVGQQVVFKWSKVSGASTYTVTVYSEELEKLSETQTEKTELKYSPENEGIVFVSVSASNEKTPSWNIAGEKKELHALLAENATVSSLSVEKTKTVSAGSKFNISVTVTPSTALKKFTWKSSDSTIASVASDGTVSAKKCGEVKITCCAVTNSSATAVCTVKVIPAKPVGLKQNASGNKTTAVSLSWSKASGATGYKIYRVKADGSYKYMGDTKSAATSYTVTGLSAGTTYTFCVRAYNTAEEKTVYSSYSSEIKAITVPEKVSGLKVSKRTTTGFTLTWNKVSGASSYVVYKYNSTAKQYKAIKTVKGTTCSLKAKQGDSAKYIVGAVSKLGKLTLNSAGSSSVYGFVKPSAVTVKATGITKGVSLSWKAVKGVTGYEIYILSSGKYKKTATVKASTLSYKVLKLKKGAKYTFKVRAYTKKNGVTVYGDYSSAVSARAK